MQKLTENEVQHQLEATATQWSQLGESITRTFHFCDFVQSMSFVNKVASLAEESQHHPDILIRWDKVSLTLSTHDAGGISEKDFAAAVSSDALADAINEQG